MSLLPQASRLAGETDWLIGSLFGVSMLVLVLVMGLMGVYVIRYREGNGVDRGGIAQKTWRIEVTWTAATLVAFFGLFVWGANLFVRINQPHTAPLTVNVIGKQWMWKVEYPGGQREINALHLPVDRDVQLVMTSEDVIHDFGLPEFRVKRDVLPGRYESLWLHPTVPGRFHLFCDQFCGTDHSSMVGTVVVMTAPDYEDWLEGNGTSQGLVAEGHALFVRYGCSGCHQNGLSGGGGTVRAPSMNGLYMSPVPLADGTTAVADDRYLHDSIIYPKEQIVASYEPVMPSFNGVIPEEDLVRIIAYIKSLAASTGVQDVSR